MDWRNDKEEEREKGERADNERRNKTSVMITNQDDERSGSGRGLDVRHLDRFSVMNSLTRTRSL